MPQLKFTVITPVWNGADKIARTIDSVLAQTSLGSGKDQLRYVIVDGASEDGTADVARSYQDPRIEVISRPDDGMYDALADGLELADGDVTCYMPAGDTFEVTAFDTVSEVFTDYAQVKWLTGRITTRNARGHILDCRLPHPFDRRLIKTGMYGTKLPFIQQESTFWRSELNDEIDLRQLRNLKLAGDFFIWTEFAKNHDIYVVNSILASFMHEAGQLSHQEPGAYQREMKLVRETPTLWDEVRTYFKIRPARRIIPRYNELTLHYHPIEDRFILPPARKMRRRTGTRSTATQLAHQGR